MYKRQGKLSQMANGAVYTDNGDVEHIHEALFAKIADLGVKNGWMLWPLRTAVSGKQFTPGGGVELCAILGKEDTLARIRKAIDALSA